MNDENISDVFADLIGETEQAVAGVLLGESMLTGDRSPVVEVRACAKCGRVVRDWYDSVDGPLCAMCGL